MYSSILFLTSALDWGVWSAPRSGSFTPWKDPVPIVMEGWVDPRAGVDGCGKISPTPGFDAGELIVFQKGIQFLWSHFDSQ